MPVSGVHHTSSWNAVPLGASDASARRELAGEVALELACDLVEQRARRGPSFDRRFAHGARPSRYRPVSDRAVRQHEQLAQGARR